MIENNLVVSLTGACVEIPLRGLKSLDQFSDSRIINRGKGGFFLKALDSVTLNVRRGDRIGIVGGNGNGKTTLLKLIAGMLPATSGKVQALGSIRSLLSIDAGIIPSLSGLENIKFYYSLLGVKSMTLPQYVDNVAEFAALGDFINMPVAIYSPGMRSRLQFAMNTVEPADILLLDEWLGVADTAFQEKANNRLTEFINKNDAFMFASHNKNLIDKMTNKLIRLDCGKVVCGNLGNG